MHLGRLGVFTFTDSLSAREAGALAMLIEHWGYGAIWIPETLGRNSLVHAAALIASTTKIVVATGIANIYRSSLGRWRHARLRATIATGGSLWTRRRARASVGFAGTFEFRADEPRHQRSRLTARPSRQRR